MTGARDSRGLFSASGVNHGLAAPRLFALATHAHATHLGRSRISDAPQNSIIRVTVLLDWQLQQVSLHLMHLIGHENSGPLMRQLRETMEESCPADNITYGLERLEHAIHAWGTAQRGEWCATSVPSTLVPARSARREKKKKKPLRLHSHFFLCLLFLASLLATAPAHRPKDDRPPVRPYRKSPTGARLHAQRTALCQSLASGQYQSVLVQQYLGTKQGRLRSGRVSEGVP
ncbi:uncharacterized protein J3D65DRAFT_70221 [Phyllosticta citribraziliensis]|uniref:Uncharacterized protein n=1 Tax=Phyllosticta citribraziliensis TaxID=989973 RepID=A0ABR1LCZ5_9PEZI